jgi:hypothetical protein
MIIEILIIGLIIVALMVYTSTKIKKKAAIAFEQEPIIAPGFSIIKPEGFIHPLESPSGAAFEAYSKEFGKNENENTRRAWIKLQVTGDELDAVKRAIKAAAESIAEDPEAEVMEVERTENGLPVNAFYKFIADGEKLYELQAVVLREHKDDYLRKIQVAFESFRVRSNDQGH